MRLLEGLRIIGNTGKTMEGGVCGGSVRKGLPCMESGQAGKRKRSPKISSFEKKLQEKSLVCQRS